MRQMGWDVQLVAPDACATPDYLELAGAAAEGAVLTTYFHRDVPDPKAQALVKTYEETFNEETFVSVPYTYDAMYVLCRHREGRVLRQGRHQGRDRQDKGLPCRHRVHHLRRGR
jgi:branched-chain amino acid transport system substrate-binding protein